MKASEKPRCYYCLEELEPKKEGGSVLHGFKDGDTLQQVCFGCQARHYAEKQQTEHAGKYSELPIVIATPVNYEAKEFDGSYADDELED